MKRRFAIVLAMVGLAACASQAHRPAQMAGQAGAPVAGPSSSLPDGSGGSYKTGAPYRVGGRWYYPMRQAASYDEVGIASWYGRKFHGRKTANGERFDMYALSAAHRTLPLPTLVRVTNLENGRSVVVRVNDRGPFVQDRLIDLSYAAAKRLGFVERGTALVRVQTLDRPPPKDSARASAPSAGVSRMVRGQEPATPQASSSRVGRKATDAAIFIQLGAFSSPINAARLRDRLAAEFDNAHIQPRRLAGQTLYRVRIGPLEDMRNIERTVQRLEQQGYTDAIVVIE